MRKAVRAVVVAGLVCAVAALPVSSRELVTAEDYGWVTAVSSPAAGVPVVDPVATNTLQPGDLPVGAFGTTEHKRSYILLGLPEGVTSAELVLPLSSSDGSQFGTAGPILACAVVGPFTVSNGGAFDDAPEVDCGDAPVTGEPVEMDGTQAYRFDITPLLGRLAANDGGPGVGLVADISEAQPLYQVTFKVTFGGSIGSAEATDDGGFGEPFAPPPDFGSATPSGTAGSSQFAAPPRTDFGTGTSTDLAFAPVIGPETAPGGNPAGEGAVAEPSATAPLAAARPSLPGPNPAVWLLIPGVVGVLALSGRALAGAGETPTTLDRLLGP